MYVEVAKGPQARRLAMDGYERIDKKEVEADFSELETLLEREDIDVETVTLLRRNRGDEAAKIDEYVRAQVPDNYGYLRHVSFAHKKSRSHSYTSDRRLQKKTNTILESKEDKLVVHSRFRDALLDGIISSHVYDHESFEKEREEMIDGLHEDIESHQQEIREIEEQIEEMSDMEPEDV